VTKPVYVILVGQVTFASSINVWIKMSLVPVMVPVFRQGSTRLSANVTLGFQEKIVSFHVMVSALEVIHSAVLLVLPGRCPMDVIHQVPVAIYLRVKVTHGLDFVPTRSSLAIILVNVEVLMTVNTSHAIQTEFVEYL